MTMEIQVGKRTEIDLGQGFLLPKVILQADEKTRYKFAEFFTATISNVNTRAAYFRAVRDFLIWCEGQGLDLNSVHPVACASYIQMLKGEKSIPTVKQHRSALKHFFDWMVVSGCVAFNPMASVKAPSYSMRKGKTPVLSTEDTAHLIYSIDVSKLKGLRDRALIGVMLYSFARIGAVTNMKVGDYIQMGKRVVFRLYEKGGKLREVPANHKAQEYVDAYIAAAGLSGQSEKPLFQTFTRRLELSGRKMHRNNANHMLAQRMKKAGLEGKISNHSLRATGITIYLQNEGKLEIAQKLAGHVDPRTTELYDRRDEIVEQVEVEKVRV